MAGLLGLDKYFFKRDEVVVKEGDADNFTEFKLYRYLKTVANLPENSDGIITSFTFYQTGNESGGAVVQVAFTQNNNIYHRIKWYGNPWSAWVRI